MSKHELNLHLSKKCDKVCEAVKAMIKISLSLSLLGNIFIKISQSLKAQIKIYF